MRETPCRKRDGCVTGEIWMFDPGDTLAVPRACPRALSQCETIIAVVSQAFRAVGLQEYTLHSFRKTLAMLADKLCKTMEQQKA